MQRESFILTLADARMVTPTVRHLEFALPEAHPFDFIPGQFITFHFEMDGVMHQRSYSVASIPGRSAHIEIAASPYEGGPGTRFLFGLQPGDQVETTGPFGRLILREEQPKRYLLIATGTGVTPYRAMLPALTQRVAQADTQAFILLGVQKPEDLLYGSDFVDYAKNHPRLEFHACYSRQMPENPKPYEHHGYVQGMFEWLKPNPETDVVYLCGNPNMIDQAFDALRALNFDTSKVRREKYISPKR